jgi:hypothetical protein
MRRVLLGGAAWLLVLAAAARAADDTPPLLLAQGVIDKVDKDTLTVRTRDADGKFGKTLALKVTGTTKVTTLQFQMRAGKPVPVQKDTDLKDLEAKQTIALVYIMHKDVAVLLTAVVQPAEK